MLPKIFNQEFENISVTDHTDTKNATNAVSDIALPLNQSTISENLESETISKKVSSSSLSDTVRDPNSNNENVKSLIGGSLLMEAREEAHMEAKDSNKLSKLIFEGFLSDDSDSDSDMEPPISNLGSTKSSGSANESSAENISRLHQIRQPVSYPNQSDFSNEAFYQTSTNKISISEAESRNINHSILKPRLDILSQPSVMSYASKSLINPSVDLSSNHTSMGSSSHTLENFMEAQMLLNSNSSLMPNRIVDPSLISKLQNSSLNNPEEPFISIKKPTKMGKLAIEKMQQESERLLRNSSVSVDSKIEKKDFGWLSKKLASKKKTSSSKNVSMPPGNSPNTGSPESLSQGFNPSALPTPTTQGISLSLQSLGANNSKFTNKFANNVVSSFTLTDKNSVFEIEISDSESQIPANNNFLSSETVSKPNTKKSKNLDSLLSNGSKSLFLMNEESLSDLGFNKPGSKGLRNLSQALWQAVMTQNTQPEPSYPKKPVSRDTVTIKNENDNSNSHDSIDAQDNIENNTSSPKKNKITYSKLNQNSQSNGKHEANTNKDKSSDNERSFNLEACDEENIEDNFSDKGIDNSDDSEIYNDFLSLEKSEFQNQPQSAVPEDSGSESDPEIPSQIKRPTVFKKNTVLAMDSDDESDSAYPSSPKRFLQNNDSIKPNSQNTPLSSRRELKTQDSPNFLTNFGDDISGTQDS
ncbi:hypothetical protein AYI69_g7410, partial [Smittium culicis]